MSGWEWGAVIFVFFLAFLAVLGLLVAALGWEDE